MSTTAIASRIVSAVGGDDGGGGGGGGGGGRMPSPRNVIP